MIPDLRNGPASGAFVPAKLRGITANPKARPDMGLSFDLVDGSVCRLSLTVDAMESLGKGVLAEVAFYRARMNSHSDNSSGHPSTDVSTQRE